MPLLKHCVQHERPAGFRRSNIAYTSSVDPSTAQAAFSLIPDVMEATVIIFSKVIFIMVLPVLPLLRVQPLLLMQMMSTWTSTGICAVGPFSGSPCRYKMWLYIADEI